MWAEWTGFARLFNAAALCADRTLATWNAPAAIPNTAHSATRIALDTSLARVVPPLLIASCGATRVGAVSKVFRNGERCVFVSADSEHSHSHSNPGALNLRGLADNSRPAQPKRWHVGGLGRVDHLFGAAQRSTGARRCSAPTGLAST